MRVHYWLAEAQLALSEHGDRRNVDAHHARALTLVRERGYLYFLRVQAREEPSALVHALARGIETEVVSAALVEAGPAIEAPLLALLPEARGSAGEAIVSLLGEIGGRDSLEELERLGPRHRSLAPAARTARRHIAERLTRGASRGEAGDTRVARLVLFGPPQLLIGGRPVPASAWRAQRAFQMLVYLALHPRGAAREELIEHFWPGRQATAGRRNFHPTLSYVRSVMPRAEEPPILREGEYYRLNPAYP